MKQVRVILAEDLGLIREGIRSTLRAAKDVEIVGEAADAVQAIRLARELKPDVILIDQDLAEGDGLYTTRLIKQVQPSVEIIVMTDRLDAAKALQAIEAGATGYILKDIPGASLATAVRAVCNGRGFCHPEITRKLMDRLGQLMRGQRNGRQESHGLTPRELDILIEVAQGHTDLEIATRFVVAEGTIKTHLRHILRKLSVRNRAHAVAYGIRKGLIR